MHRRHTSLHAKRKHGVFIFLNKNQLTGNNKYEEQGGTFIIKKRTLFTCEYFPHFIINLCTYMFASKGNKLPMVSTYFL
ncbi:hypothetical protein AK88_02254 [Plasmodium fragile]|uniref:Uncharacterized protein n=1 Tax=Plasmodium fragile TaxID=5857 RepID=A0A0D9QMY8_PLAFR|nr:uncharacterized protein AK88_02254 [Plasmodium fragile]KJP88137.1 hypothetical protein AK88_02254 [Plasmodium fragile]